MQLHDLKLEHHPRKARRVGRGGKRGTFSGKGSKGQQARGARLGPDFRGGNRPLWKVFPKLRGANKKTEKKHRFFRMASADVTVINLGKISQLFSAGEAVNLETLLSKGVIAKAVRKVKILGQGELDKSLNFSGLEFSKSAREKILKNGEIKS